MSQGNVCRLCVEICEDSKSLYDESDTANEVHQLMIQYFDQQFFTGNNYTAICLKCWRQISDFNNFQQSVYRAQRILLIKDEEIDIKSEEEFLPEDNIAGNSKEQLNDCNSFLKSESESMDVSSSGDCSKAYDNLEFDSPVSEFIGGEFDNGDNFTESPIAAALNAVNQESSTTKNRSTGSISHKLRGTKRYRLAMKASDDLIAQWKPVLKCAYCSETRSSYSLLQRHCHHTHPLCQYQIRCCGKIFFRRSRYEDHIRMHIDSNAFSCTFCGRQQSCRRTLALHIRMHHSASMEATVYPTDDSNTVSQSSEKVTGTSTESIPKNTGEYKEGRKPYIKDTDEFIAKMIPTLKCYLCSKSFSTFSLYRRHFSLSHSQSKCYITCCERKLAARFRIVEHLQLHDNPDVFKCELCAMRTGSRYQLGAHMRSHHSTLTNEKPKRRKKYKMQSDELLAKWLPSTMCAVCKKAFDTLNLLQCHFGECHPNERFYVECCQRKLETRSAIEVHVLYHVEPTGYKCDLCGIHYSQERIFQRHMRSTH